MRYRRAEQSCARVLIARCAANAIDDLGAIADAVLAAPSDVPVRAAEPSVVVDSSDFSIGDVADS